MVSQFKNLVRAAVYAVALLGLSGAPLWAQASACPQNAVGGQSGQSYTLQSQSLVTETRTVELSAGGTECGIGGSTTVQTTEQYNVGYYENEDGDVARVDCRTGRILGWV